MRNLLAIAAVVLIAVGALGYYQGWFTVEKTKTGDGHTTIKVDIDGNKVEDDVNSVKKKITGN